MTTISDHRSGSIGSDLQPHRRQISKKTCLRMAVSMWLLGYSLISFANVDKAWVFCDVDPRQKEVVKYCVEPFAKDNDAWVGFIADAAKEWSDATSWKITKTDDCSEAQITIKQGGTKGTGKTVPQKQNDQKCNKHVTITLKKQT